MVNTDKGDVMVRNMVLGAGVATTLFIWTPLSDPVNIPKLLILSLIAAWLLGNLIYSLATKGHQNLSVGHLAVVVFVIGIFLSAFVSDERYTAFYGAAGRGNGAISYIALAVICFAAMSSFDAVGIGKFRNMLISIGLFISAYGFLQTTHSDPIKWNLLYNPIVATLGNPDFVSALLGVCTIATLWWVLKEVRNNARWIGILIILFEIFIIRRSGSFQGLLVFALGSSILIAARLWSWKKSYGQLALGAISVGSVPVLMGLFNTGPFADHLYRGSIQSRIDYWQAAISMVKAHPFFGVGLDRIGDNYWQYAPLIRTVASQSTDNVHNVFLQLFATGGIVLFLPYLFLIGVIVATAIRASRMATKGMRIDLFALFAIWLSLLAVSAISIDTLGVSIWFWISSGALYSFSSKILKEPAPTPKVKSRNGKQLLPANQTSGPYLSQLLSGVMVVVIFLIVVPAWRSSQAIQDLQVNRRGLDRNGYSSRLVEVANWWPKNPQTLVFLSDLSLRVSDSKTARALAGEAITKDNRSYNALLLSALAYELENNIVAAIPFREKMMKLNSWNTPNLIKLAKDYLATGNSPRAKVIAKRVNQIDPNGADTLALIKLLKG